MKTEMGVVIYVFKTFPRFIDSKYIWVYESNSLGSTVLLKYHFWHFQPYTGKGRGVAR